MENRYKAMTAGKVHTCARSLRRDDATVASPSLSSFAIVLNACLSSSPGLPPPPA
jgi:hypothetical protein